MWRHAARKAGCCTLAACCWAGAAAGDWSGWIAGEWRLFPHSPNDSRQFEHASASLALQAEYTRSWDNQRRVFSFVPFLRLDEHDAERTHADIRELSYVQAEQNWELRLGIRKVFWGVTESAHLVDIVNQTDLVENLDGEEKFGQPMLNLALVRDWGTVDFFLLPGFRERSFPGREGRLRFGPVVDTDDPSYESGARQRRVDAAVRWSHHVGIFDFGVAHFSGTHRESRFLLNFTGAGEPVLRPRYDVIDQTSVDLQATSGSWLWKFEWLSRTGQGDRYTAAVGGFEYTFYGVAQSSYDLGLLTEYLFDDRGSGFNSPFQNDLFAGARLTLNDAQSSELLAGVIQDLEGGGRVWSLEASRRLGASWRLAVEARAFTGIPVDNVLSGLRDDDYFELSLTRYF